MFKQKVGLINEIPRETINKVCKQTMSMDDSFAMTALMLFYERVENFKINIIEANNAEVIRKVPDEYAFYFVASSTISPDEFLKPVKSEFKSIEKLPTHEKFISDKLGSSVHIRLMQNENVACVFAPKTMEAWHCIQFFIPKFYKIFKEKPLTKEEVTFLESLTFKMDSNYITKLKELTHKESFSKFILKDQITAFEKRLFDKKVWAARERVSKMEKEMEESLEKYKIACGLHQTAMELLYGLEYMSDKTEEHTELQDYLMNSKRISCVKLDDSYISFVVKTYLAPHHIDEWDTLSKNNSYFTKYVLTNVDVFSYRENVKLLLNAIFSSKRSLKLKICAYFKMDYYGSEVDSRRGFAYTEMDKSLKDYIPNPHIDNYNCFLANKAAILEHLKMGDAIGAIESAIACAQRVNIHEGMNFDPFVKKLLSSKCKCLVADDGTELSPADAIEYLKGNIDE